MLFKKRTTSLFFQLLCLNSRPESHRHLGLLSRLHEGQGLQLVDVTHQEIVCLEQLGRDASDKHMPNPNIMWIMCIHFYPMILHYVFIYFQILVYMYSINSSSLASCQSWRCPTENPALCCRVLRRWRQQKLAPMPCCQFTCSAQMQSLRVGKNNVAID